MPERGSATPVVILDDIVVDAEDVTQNSYKYDAQRSCNKLNTAVEPIDFSEFDTDEFSLADFD